jgi:hypothetical protein
MVLVLMLFNNLSLVSSVKGFPPIDPQRNILRVLWFLNNRRGTNVNAIRAVVRATSRVVEACVSNELPLFES